MRLIAFQWTPDANVFVGTDHSAMFFLLLYFYFFLSNSLSPTTRIQSIFFNLKLAKFYAHFNYFLRIL